MKSFISVLGMATAAFAAVIGARAADVPSKKVAPVDYVRVCTAHGAGFFYIPGTDSCLRISGRLRLEYAVGDRYGDAYDSYGTRARGRVNADIRTQTAYGTLRAFFRYELGNSSNMFNGAIGGNSGFIVPGAARTSQTATALSMDLAFVQLGPVIAGRAQSFFDFYANDLGFSALRTSDSKLNLLAYTATFGAGFSATISLEDRVSGTGARDSFAVSTTSIANAAVVTGTGNATSLGTLDFGRAVPMGGQEFPDLVASLRVDQGWGSAQLSGAFRQNRVTALTTTFPGQVAAIVPGTHGGDNYGWAVQGGVKVNLPMLAAGDYLWLQAAYADGALGYIGYGGVAGIGRLPQISAADIGFDPLTGQVKNSTGFSIVAGLRHYWIPNLRSELYGSYSELSLAHTAPAAIYGNNAVVRALDPKELIVAGNLIWTPVSGLDVGVEVIYYRVEYKSRVQNLNNLGIRVAGVGIKSDDAWAGRMRIQHDF